MLNLKLVNRNKIVAQSLLVFACWAYSLRMPEHTQEGHREEEAL